MPLKNNDEFQELTNEEADKLFDRFSFPIMRSCITARQKKSAIGIAKILWLRLITGMDTEEQIYEDLRGVLNNVHDDIIAIGSLYFFKMKTTLTAVEICRLKDYFSDKVNFVRLSTWEPSIKNRPYIIN